MERFFLFLILLSGISIGFSQPLNVSDLNFGSGSTNPSNFLNLNEVLFFSGYNSPNGRELFFYDGNPSGPQLLKDINPGSNSNPLELTKVGNLILFSADDGVNGIELWKTDGTLGGTQMIKDINDGGNGDPTSLTEVNGNVFFSGTENSTGTELWITDGTPAGTVLLMDINPSGSGNPQSLFASDSILYFSADDGINGRELWRSNGTPAGTYMIEDMNPGTSDGNPQSFFANGNKLYFSGNGGVDGFEPRVMDMTLETISILNNINPSGSSNPSDFFAFGSRVFFVAETNLSGRELYQSYLGLVTQVKDINPGNQSSNPTDFVQHSGNLYFFAENASTGIELWKFDGVLDSLFLFHDMVTGTGDGQPENLIKYGDSIYFSLETVSMGRELWSTDGGAVLPHLVADINPAINSSSPENFTVVNGDLYFSAYRPDIGNELWKINGCSPGILAPNREIVCNGDSLFLSSELGELGSQYQFQSFLSNSWLNIGPVLSGNSIYGDLPLQSLFYRVLTVCNSVDTVYSEPVLVRMDEYPDSTVLFPLASLCINANPVNLLPQLENGTWLGPGVQGFSFYPSEAGEGTHTLTLDTYNGPVCRTSSHLTVSVFGIPASIIDSIGPFCPLDSPLELTSPSIGGVWSGSAVSNGFFYPSSGEGIHTVVYSIIDSNGCQSSESIDVEVFEETQVTLDFAETNFCDYDSLTVPLFALPTGGTWTGNGVAGSVFLPVIAGSGLHEVTYSIIDVHGCSVYESIYLGVSICLDREDEAFLQSDIYPNPNNGLFYVSKGLQESKVTMITNSLGQIVDYELLDRGLFWEVNLKETVSGFYFVHFDGDTSFSKKFQVQNP